MMRKSVYVFLSCFLLSGCGMIDYHPYDVRISGETEVNAHNIERIEANCQGKTTIRFVTMGDSQRWYDETEDFVKAINQPILDCYSLKTYESLLLCTKTVFLD